MSVFEVLSGGDLRQGDILDDCQVVKPANSITYPISEGQSIVEVAKLDVIVMSQSCDLARPRPDTMVILCPIFTLSKLADKGHLKSNYERDECRKGNYAGYHMLNACELESWEREISIVYLREVISLPFKFIQEMALQAGERLRLCSPYTEHLSQSFARFFMRVGLPYDIPKFPYTKHEERAIRHLKGLEPDERQALIDSLYESDS